MPRKATSAALAACVGHALEWYDFSVYAFVAADIARAEFPSQHESAALLGALAAFGVGFLARPIGGVTLGTFADRFGSKAALILGFSLMGGATLGLGLVPSFARIGLLAPTLVILLRLLQGFSAGGEFATSASYVVSSAPEYRKGLFGSFQHMGSGLGALMGAALSYATSVAIPAHSMLSWGWRVPFLMGGIVLLLGLVIRRNAPEVSEDSGLPLEEYGRIGQRAVRLFLFSGGWAVPYYLLLFYLPTFAQTQLRLAERDALLVGAVGLVIYTALLPLTGLLSDLIGRRKTILIGCAACILLGFPAFDLMSRVGGFWTYLASQLTLNLALLFISGPGPATIVEMFPGRCLAWLNGTYAISLAVFGGFTPFAVAASIPVMGSIGAPLALLIGAALLCGAAIAASPETAPIVMKACRHTDIERLSRLVVVDDSPET